MIMPLMTLFWKGLAVDQVFQIFIFNWLLQGKKLTDDSMGFFLFGKKKKRFYLFSLFPNVCCVMHVCCL